MRWRGRVLAVRSGHCKQQSAHVIRTGLHLRLHGVSTVSIRLKSTLNFRRLMSVGNIYG